MSSRICARHKRFSPHMTNTLVDQINDVSEAGMQMVCSMVPALRKDGFHRLCIDQRELNKLFQRIVNG